MMHRTRGTATVSSLIEGLVGRLDKTGEGKERARAIAAWRLVAGTEVFAHARGFALRGDELLIFVDSPVWANELQMLSEHYRIAVNERIGKEAVGSIRFAVSKKVAEEVRRDVEDEEVAARLESEKVVPVPATETERDQVRAMAAGMKPGELREAVVAATIAHLEWQKGLEAHQTAENAIQGPTGPSSPL